MNCYVGNKIYVTAHLNITFFVTRNVLLKNIDQNMKVSTCWDMKDTENHSETFARIIPGYFHWKGMIVIGLV